MFTKLTSEKVNFMACLKKFQIFSCPETFVKKL
jgi:hypothetical protein